MKNLKNKPVTNPIAEDAINREPQTPEQNDNGIPYRSSLVTPPVNDFWYQLSKQMQYENFTGGYYSASTPYDEGNVVKLIRQNEDSSYEMMFFIRLGSNIDLTTDNPPIKNATTVNLNGIYVYVGGEENSDWQKVFYYKTDIVKLIKEVTLYTEQYTFIVDSDEKLRLMHECSQDGNLRGNDFSRILIKARSTDYMLNITLSGGDANNPKFVFNGEVLGCKYIFSEQSGNIEINNTNNNGSYVAGFYKFSNINNVVVKLNHTETGTNVGYGFRECTQLTNCTGTSISKDASTGMCYGFRECTQLRNCTGTGISTVLGIGYGFSKCTQLTNCTGTGTGTDASMNPSTSCGFSECTQLTNCTGTGTGSARNVGCGFSSCIQLTNCTGIGTGANTTYVSGFGGCTQLTNCIGTGASKSTGANYGFSDCNIIAACKTINANNPNNTNLASGCGIIAG